MKHPRTRTVVLLLSLVAASPLAGAAEPVVLAQAADPGGTPPPEEIVPEPASPPPQANNDIEEIVVQGGESDAVSDLESSDSVTGFDASDLEALGAQSVEDLAAFTPNLEIVSSGATTPTFFIRGVGLNDFNANSSGAVAILQDDVVKNAPALQLSTLYDMEAVNILRGPQGTGSVRNASAGAIKLYSRKPSGGFGGFLRSSVGNFDARDFEGAVEVPIYEDLLAGRFSFRFSERDGVRKNRCGGGATNGCNNNTNPAWINGTEALVQDSVSRVNDLGNWSARGVLRFQPTLDMDWLLTAQGSRRDERSQLGEAYGTNQRTFKPECVEEVPPNEPLRNLGVECQNRRTLGGPTSSDYLPPELRERLAELDPCRDLVNGVLVDNGKCPVPPPNFVKDRTANAAQLQLAEELVDLDSRPWEGSYNRTGPTTNDVWNVALKGDIALAPSLFLTTVTGYDTYDRFTDVDLDASPDQLFEITTDDDGWQVYQNLELAGSLQDAPFNWRVGAYFLKEELNVAIENNFNPAAGGNTGLGERDYTQDLLNAAPWLSADWTFWNDFTLDGGVRYNWERKKIDFTLLRNSRVLTFNDTRDWSAPTGTVRLTYRFREDTHAYWKYTRGWKGGHFNATTDVGIDCGTDATTTDECGRKGVTVAEPETINAFEGGVRGSWFQGKLGLDASFFYYDYDNYQIFTVQENVGGDPNFLILNANKAEVYGAEADLVGRPFPGTFLQVRFSWLESQFLDFVQTQQTQEQGPNNTTQFFDIEIQNTGNNLLNSPKFKVSLTAEQTIPLGRYGTLTPRYDGAWTDTTFFDATEGRGIPTPQGDQFLPKETIAQSPFWLHNVRLGYRVPDGSIELAGWVRNVADKAYKNFGFDGSTFNNTTIFLVGEPRTFGLTLTTSF